MQVSLKLRWFMTVLTVLVVAGLLAMVLSTRAARSDSLSIAPGYPGQYADGSVFLVGSSTVQMGVQGYYKVYGRYPDSWSAVVQTGIVQTGIPALGGEWIDPDDSSLDFADDLFYDASPIAQGKLPRVLWSPPLGNQPVKTQSFTPPTTYDDFLAMAPDLGFQASPYVGDRNWQSLFASLMCLEQMIVIYKKVHGEWPASQDEFFSSGLATIDRTSINPVTGQLFRFDGSPGDVKLEFGGQSGYLLRHIGLDGQLPVVGFTY